MLKHTFFTEVLLSNPYRLRLIVDYVQIYLERRQRVPTKLKNLKLTSVSLVDQGGKPKD